MATKVAKEEIIVTSGSQLTYPEPGVYEVPDGCTAIRIVKDSVPLYRKLVIPASVTHIEGLLWIANCWNIEVSPDNPAYCSINGVVYSKDKATLVAYPAGREGGAKHDRNTYIVPDSVKIIADDAFFANHTLHEIVLPDGLMHIGQRAFAQCKLLISVNLPDSLLSMGANCFVNSDHINRLHFPSSLECLYTSNLSSGIVIEIADKLTNWVYDSIPDGYLIDTNNSEHQHPMFHALVKPTLLIRNNPTAQYFADAHNFVTVKNFYTDSDGIIWAINDNGTEELLCFPRRWHSDRYQVHGIIRINERAFCATEVSYLWADWSQKKPTAKDKFTFSGNLMASAYQPPSPRGQTIYKIRPGVLPSLTPFFDENSPYFFLTTVGRTYRMIMGNTDSKSTWTDNNAEDDEIKEPLEYDTTIDNPDTLGDEAGDSNTSGIVTRDIADTWDDKVDVAEDKMMMQAMRKKRKRKKKTDI